MNDRSLAAGSWPFIDTLRLVWASRRLLAITMVAGALLALGISFLQTPIYRSECTLAAMEPVGGAQGLSALASQLGGLAGAAGLLGKKSGETDEWIAILKSRALAESFIAKNNLLPVLFEKRWDEQKNTWREGELPPTPDMAYRLFDSSIRQVSKDAQTGLVTLRIEWKSPTVAAAWAADLVALANKQIRDRAIADADASLEFLQQEVTRTANLDLQTAIYGLIQTQINARMLASVREQYAFKILDPPAVSDTGAYVRPSRLLDLALGFVLTGILGVVYVLTRASFLRAELSVRSEISEAS